MNVFGNTCPMCCGDLEDVAYLRTGAAVCLSCGYNVAAAASAPSTPQRPDATAFSASAMRDPAMAQALPSGTSPTQDIQVQTSAGIALP